MNDPRLDRAEKLLAKARSTPYDAEARSLLAFRCRLLAEVLVGDHRSLAGRSWSAVAPSHIDVAA